MTHRFLSYLTVLLTLAGTPRIIADYPIVAHRYLADPGALVHDGRVYLYCSNDDDNPTAGDYAMKSIVCVSSCDLKNWTDHGEVLRVPLAATWAAHSWAPAAIERNGKFFLYFGNGGSGIGVASSTSPTGPFADAKGSVLINSATPGVMPATNMWIFDPAVFIDDDGQAYLYFGGNGESNVRVIRLAADMVTTTGAAITLTAPAFFEASWMHKRNGLYYFSYSTNPSTGLRIDYMTSASPTSGFTYGGIVAGQPPSNNNNNHHAVFQLAGAWYHAYHNRSVATQAGIPTGYRRNLAIERLTYAQDGSIQQVGYSTDGVAQTALLNPYARVEAETMAAQSGIETGPCSEGGMNLTDLQSGDWVKVRGVNFGSAGAYGFNARVASAAEGGAIELRLDSPTGTLIGTCPLPATGSPQAWTTTSCAVTGATGAHDLYLRFTGTSPSLGGVNWWQFTTTAMPEFTPVPRTDANSRLAHEQLLAKARQGGIDLYFLGDSITRRWGATDYPAFLANWNENFFGWNAADFGWGADGIQNILWRVENGEIDGVNPKVIVLLAGTNNVGQAPASEAKIADIVLGIRTLLDRCRHKAPGATIVLTAIFPRNDSMAVMPSINQINAEIAKFADGQSIRFLNINDKLADTNGVLFPGMTGDNLHPTLQGYQVWADALQPLLTELLGPRAVTDHAPPPTGDPSAAQPAGPTATRVPFVPTQTLTTTPAAASAGMVIGTVQVIDVDGAVVSGWQITGATGNAPFTLNATTGQLAIASGAVLEEPSYELAVTARNNFGTSAAGRITVVVSNEPPRLTGCGYEVMANIVHQNGNVYDQILITGPLLTIRADAGQIVRASGTFPTTASPTSRGSSSRAPRRASAVCARATSNTGGSPAIRG
ncbi:MAG: carbohydrate-binding protein [Opitutaceae bacterium]|nr:carbohydrate-binding protein [Opitutaceae bacterium]